MNIQPKKSLGQNFLKDEKALGKIIEAAELSEKDNVLEIGPGTGVLTQELVKRVGKVVAVEKDEKLAALVHSQFQISNFQNKPQFPNINENLTVIINDILKVNVPKLVEEHNFFDYKLVANIPYYITGQIVRLFLETKYPPKMMVLLVQKEVAERICAQTGQMSILAVSVQYYGAPEIIDIVPKESFYPAPEVDSAILKIVLNKKYSEQDKQFFRIVKIGFSSKRKTLINNLSVGLKIEKEKLAAKFNECGLHEQVRAQELSVEKWLQLKSILEKR